MSYDGENAVVCRGSISLGTWSGGVAVFLERPGQPDLLMPLRPEQAADLSRSLLQAIQLHEAREMTTGEGGDA